MFQGQFDESALRLFDRGAHGQMQGVRIGRGVFGMRRRTRAGLDAAGLPLGLPFLGAGYALETHWLPQVAPMPGDIKIINVAQDRFFNTDLDKALADLIKNQQNISDQIAKANAELKNAPALDIVRWAVAQSNGRAIVSTNFRPYEAVLLHMVSLTQPDMSVLWVDHGYNRPATYKHAEQLRSLLRLDLKPYLPRMTAAHYDAIHGGMPEPTPENEERIKAFSTAMKLEPFQRGMKELAPTVWLTALRKVQNPNRAGLDIVSPDGNFNSLKVSPVFHWSDAEMEAYLKQHNLPNEWDYFDPAKADEKRECGLHASWGGKAVAQK